MIIFVEFEINEIVFPNYNYTHTHAHTSGLFFLCFSSFLVKTWLCFGVCGSAVKVTLAGLSLTFRLSSCLDLFSGFLLLRQHHCLRFWPWPVLSLIGFDLLSFGKQLCKLDLLIIFRLHPDALSLLILPFSLSLSNLSLSVRFASLSSCLFIYFFWSLLFIVFACPSVGRSVCMSACLPSASPLLDPSTQPAFILQNVRWSTLYNWFQFLSRRFRFLPLSPFCNPNCAPTVFAVKTVGVEQQTCSHFLLLVLLPTFVFFFPRDKTRVSVLFVQIVINSFGKGLAVHFHYIEFRKYFLSKWNVSKSCSLEMFWSLHLPPHLLTPSSRTPFGIHQARWKHSAR